MHRVMQCLTEWPRAIMRHTYAGTLGRRLTDPYDIQTVEVMRRVLAPDSACLDVGANNGTIMRQMHRVAPNGAHIAFEPIPRLAARLRRRFPSTRVHQVAISDATGEADFLLVKKAPGYSGLRRRLYPWKDPRIVRIRVRVARIDDLISPDEPVHFIKMDIEGGEYHALLGARRLIQRDRPVIVFEAGVQSTGQYGVTAADMYDLVAVELHYDIWTMARWLEGEGPMTREQFTATWLGGPDWMFLATPRADDVG